MNPDLAILYFAPDSVLPLARAQQQLKHIDGLAQYGFEVSVCRSTAQLYKLVRPIADSQPDENGVAAFAVLNGPLSDNCRAATYLQALHPEVGIVGLVDELVETAVISSLQSGVDTCCLRMSSSHMLAATVFGLLRRCRGARRNIALHGAVRDEGCSKWKLRENGWVLVDPDGERVRLTTGERAFLLALSSAPGLRASHADLLTAVDACYAPGMELRTGQSRLGVLVSRMRSKFLQHKIELPIKSVHSWGYMFTAAIAQ